MNTFPRLLCSQAWSWPWAWAEVIFVTSELKWLGSECILSIILICWLKNEGYKGPEEGGATGRKKPRLLRVWWKTPNQNTFPGLWCAQGTNSSCVKALRCLDLSVRVASIIWTNTVLLGKCSLNTIPLHQEELKYLWHQVQGYVPWQLLRVQIFSVAGKWVGVKPYVLIVTQGGSKMNTLLSKLCHLTRTPAWIESSCISFWR